MKKYNRIMALLLICILTLPWIPGKAFAAGGSLQISGGSCKVGETVSVSVSASASEGDIAAMDVTLSYDASILEYAGSSVQASGGAGSVRLVAQNGAPGQASLSASVQFKAIAGGTAAVNVSNYKIANFNEEVLDIGQPGGASVSVTSDQGSSSGGRDGNQGGGGSGGSENPGGEKKSANNQLSSLKVSPGTLSPAFQGSTTKYTLKVPAGTAEVAVSATPMEKEAEVVSVSGTKLSGGKTTVKIVVRAPNGNEATYSIAVSEGEETPKETEKPEKPEEPKDEALEAAVGDEILLVSEKFSEENIPQGFEPYTATYKGKEVKGAKMTNAELYLIYLVDQNKENGKFYLYDAQTETFSNFIQIPIGLSAEEGGFLIPIPVGAQTQVPEGYGRTDVELDGVMVEGYQKTPDGGGQSGEDADGGLDGNGAGDTPDAGDTPAENGDGQGQPEESPAAEGDGASTKGFLSEIYAMIGPMTVYATEQGGAEAGDENGSQEPAADDNPDGVGEGEDPEAGVMPISAEPTDYQLIYAIDNNGLKDWYSFDPTQQTFQRYQVVDTEPVDTGDSDTAAQLSALQSQMSEMKADYEKQLGLRLKIMLVLAFVSAVLLIIVINLAFKVRRLKRGDDDWDDGDEDDDDDWIEQIPIGDKIVRKTQEELRRTEGPIPTVKPDLRELTPPPMPQTPPVYTQPAPEPEPPVSHDQMGTVPQGRNGYEDISSKRILSESPVSPEEEEQILSAVEELMRDEDEFEDIDIDIDLDTLNLDDDF